MSRHRPRGGSGCSCNGSVIVRRVVSSSVCEREEERERELEKERMDLRAKEEKLKEREDRLSVLENRFVMPE